jgi:hypothetical protein
MTKVTVSQGHAPNATETYEQFELNTAWEFQRFRRDPILCCKVTV